MPELPMGGIKDAARAKRAVEVFVFSTKWTLVPFYAGLMAALVFYCVHFLRDLLHFLTAAHTEDSMLMGLLHLVDMTMIANLAKMIVTGSYTSFVDKTPSDSSERTSSGLLKVKMATSLVGVSSIQLLQSFINAGTLSNAYLRNQLLLHGTFVAGALALAWIDRLHCMSDRSAAEGVHKE